MQPRLNPLLLEFAAKVGRAFQPGKESSSDLVKALLEIDTNVELQAMFPDRILRRMPMLVSDLRRVEKLEEVSEDELRLIAAVDRIVAARTSAGIVVSDEDAWITGR
jgi:hypothetical protein